jgi:DNA-binding MarR family transcriptional regulator
MVTAIGERFRGPGGHVGYLLRQAHQAFRTAAQAELGPLGLTLPQYSVLTVADAEPGLSGAELARDSMLTPQTTNEIISLLVAAGLLERRPDASDKRLRRMFVTGAGRDLLSRARPAVNAVERRMTTSLSRADRAMLRGWLTDCARNLAPGPEIIEEKTP